MPDKRQHRGPHPEDAELFAPDVLPILQTAAAEYCWLLSRGYSGPSALKLVGDRHQLVQRQRTALARFSCSDEILADRLSRCVLAEQLPGHDLLIDGFNVLVTLEAALGKGLVLHARDGCYRDLASMHGTYRQAAETTRALEMLGEILADLRVTSCRIMLDSPVSNSGRLGQKMRRLAESRGWPWRIELVTDPDALLATADTVIVTADSGILDRCGKWLNLARLCVERCVPSAWIVDLGRERTAR